MSCEPAFTPNNVQLNLFAFEEEQISAEELLEMTIPCGIKLKTETKEYKLTETPKFETTLKVKECVEKVSTPFSESLGKQDLKPLSFLRAPLFSEGAKQEKKWGERPQLNSVKASPFKQNERVESIRPEPAFSKNTEAQSKSEARAPIKASTHKQESRLDALSNTASKSYMQGPKLAQHDTLNWWENRYAKREIKREDEKQQKKDQGQNKEEKEEKKPSVNKIGKKRQTYETPEERALPAKPVLERPKLGVFALYYILTKLGIVSDGVSNYSYKKEIEVVDTDTTKAHQERLEEMKKALEKERSAQRWGIAQTVFSWIGSLFGIFTGIVLIATGVGAVAGAMMLVAGIIQITSQILELTGAWNKIADLLPGDDPEKKRAVITWIQIGIAVLCLILSGIGVVWGGYSNFNEAMGTAQALIGGIANMGHGASTIGKGISQFMFKDRISEVRRYDIKLAQLKHQRDDLMDKVELGLDRLEQLFEDLSRALHFEVELFRADQMVNLRG